MTAWLVSTALASPGMAGAAHLGSLPIEPGTAWACGGGVALWTPYSGAGGVLLQVGAAIDDRFAFDLQLATELEHAAGFPAALAGRYLLVDEPDVRVAATLTAFVFPLRGGYELDDWSVFGALSPGIALDAGGERVRFDLAVPVWGLTSYDRYVGYARVPFPLYGTLGVNFQVSDATRLRLGLPELVSVGWQRGNGYFDLGGFTVFAAGAVWTKFGLAF